MFLLQVKQCLERTVSVLGLVTGLKVTQSSVCALLICLLLSSSFSSPRGSHPCPGWADIGTGLISLLLSVFFSIEKCVSIPETFISLNQKTISLYTRKVIFLSTRQPYFSLPENNIFLPDNCISLYQKTVLLSTRKLYFLIQVNLVTDGLPAKVVSYI